MKKNYLKVLTLLFVVLMPCYLTAQFRLIEEGFEEGIPAGWTQEQVYGNADWIVQTGPGLQYPTGAHSGQSRAYFYQQGSTPARTKLISPLVTDNDANLDEPVLIFHYAMEKFSETPTLDTLRVYYRTSTASSWTLLREYVQLKANWILESIPIDAVADAYQFAFEGSNGNGRGIVLDDIYFGNALTCATPPDNLQTLNIRSDEATVSWSGNIYASYHLYVSTTQGAPPANPVGLDVDTLFNSYKLLTGLQPSTTYYFYVRSDCGYGDVSNWAAGSFKTGCSPATELNETFDSWTTGTSNIFTRINGCWTTYAYDQTGALSSTASHWPVAQAVSTTYSPDGTKTLKLSPTYSATSSNVTYNIAYIVSPEIASSVDLSQMQLTFSMHAGANSVLRIGISDYPRDLSNYTEIQAVRCDNAGTIEYKTVPLNTYTGSGKYIVFYASGLDVLTTVNADREIYLDNVTLQPLDSCETFRIGTADVSVTSNSANLLWNEHDATKWNLKVSTRPINPNFDVADVFDGETTANSKLVNNLSPGSSYFYYIQPVCAENIPGLWSAELKFVTACDPDGISMFPHKEYFDGWGTMTNGVNNSFPSCWGRSWTYSGTANAYPRVNSDQKYSLPGSLHFGANSNSYSMAVTPKINADLSTLQLRFMGRGTSSVQFIIGVSPDGNADTENVIPIDTVIPASTTADWVEYIVKLDKYTGEHKYIVFLEKTENTSQTFFHMDDLVIEKIPTCFNPADFKQTARTDNSISLSWSPGGSETNWEIAYGKSGFDPSIAAVRTIVSTTQPSATIADLPYNAALDFYVRAACGGTDGNSNWTVPVTFTTPQVPVTVPYVTKFESAEDNSQWTFLNGVTYPNKWYIGSAAYASGNSGMYVSTSGVQNDYANTGSGSMYIYTYRILDFAQAGLYDVAFRWRAKGDGNNDFMRAFLVPDVKTITNASANGISATATPADWIALGGVLNAQENWRDTVFKPTILEPGKYKLVFYWANNNSVANYPAAAIDSVSVEKNTDCMRVRDNTIKKINDTDAMLHFIGFNTETWDLKVSTTAIPEADLAITTASPFDGTIDTTAYLIPGLQPEITYYYYLKSPCDTVWASGSFTTRCARVALPVEENFDSYPTTPTSGLNTSFLTCWTRIHNQTTAYPYVYSTQKYSGTASLYVNTTASNHAVAVTPMLNVEKLNKVQVIFMGRKTSAAHRLIVGAMEDPDDITTFVPVDTVSPAAVNIWEYFEVPFDKYNGKSKYIAFYSFNTATQFCIDDLVIDLLPPCRTPVNLKTNNVTSSSADFTWTGYNAEAFNVKISTASIDPETQAADFYDGQLDTLGLTLNTLRYNTQYYWYVQNLCGDDGVSLWSKETTFRTECTDSVSLPYKESFDTYDGGTGTGTFPYCWTAVKRYSSYPQLSTTNSSSPASLYFNGGGDDYQLVAIPKLAVDDISKLQVKFKARIGSSSSDNNSGIAVGVITDIDNPATFVALDTIKRTQSNSVFYDYTVDLSGYTGSGKYIAFSSNVGSSTSNTTYIDDVVIEHNPAYITCVHPVAVSVSNITHNSARIAWNENGGIPEHYNIKIVSYPIDPAFEDADVAFITSVDNDHYVANGIFSPATTYYVYVQAVCNDTDSSYWSDAGVFGTTCPPVSTFPFVENFESYEVSGTTTFPSCWRAHQQRVGTPGSGWIDMPYVSTGDADAQVSNYLRFPTSGNKTGDYTVVYVVMPQMDVDVKNYQLTFRHKSLQAIDANISVGVMTDWTDVSTFVPMDTFTTAGNTNWNFYLANFSDYEGSGKFIAFRTDGDLSKDYYHSLLDSVRFEAIPDCAAPYNVRRGAVTTTSAAFTWKAGKASDTQWSYVLTSQEVDLSLVAATDSLTKYKIKEGSVSTPFCTINELASGTIYYFYVKNDCGVWYPSGIRAITECAGNIPLFESFESTVSYDAFTYAFPLCWSRMLNYPRNNLISGTQERALYCYSGTATDYSIAVTPELITDNIQGLRARFRAYKTGTAATINVLIGIMTNPADTATFVPVDTITLNSAATWYNIRVPFRAYEGTGKYVAFLSRAVTGLASNGVYIDNLWIEKDIDCEVPVNIKLVHRTDSTFTVNWNKVEGQTSWEVAYGLSGFDVSSGTGYTTEVVTDSFFVGENLPNTYYDVYVRALCGENDASPWTDKITFLSFQKAASVPYFNGFEGTEGEDNGEWTFIEGTSGTDKNYWIVGEAAAVEGIHSLYITKDGTTNSSNDKSTYSYAYRTVDLPKGNYEFSFRWKGMGYTSNDFLKVLLIPDTIALIPNVSNNISASGLLQPKSYIDLSGSLSESNVWSRHTKTLAITESLAGRYNLVFYWKNGSSYAQQPPAAVDSISIELAPCTTPINLKATEITGTSAKLGWTNHNSFDWHIKVFSQPMGIDTVGLYTGDVLDSIADTNPFFLENLTEATRYYWFVKADCDSVWVGANFMTVCPVPKTLPLYESFDFNAAGVNSNEFYQYYADCWTRINTFPEPEPTQYGITRYQYAPYYASTKYNGVASLWFLANASGNSMGVMPAIDIQDISKVHMTFKGRKGNADRADNLIIGVMDNPDDFSSFTQVTTVTSPEANTNWHPLEVSLSAYTGSGKYIAFYCASEGGVTNQFYIDDLRVGCWEEHDYYDSTCKGYDYERYGFTIDRSELYETGLRKFTRTALTTTTGCDSIVNLYLTVGENTRDTIYAAVCEGGVYTYEGIEYRETGKYTLSYNSAAGCDSVVVLDFKVNPNYFFESTTIICAGSIYEWRGQEISETGVYYDSLKTVTTACDSIYKLNVNVVFEERVTLNEEICEGNVYAFKGTYISEPGTYIDTLRNMNNCDSIVTLNLKVNRVYNITQPVTLCAGTTSYEGYGFSLLDPNGIRPESHIHRGTTVYGCDSTFTLVVSISEALSTLIEDEICQGETYDPGSGFIKIQDTDERLIFIKEETSILGCDSTTSIIVTKMPAYELFEELQLLTSDLPYVFGDTVFDVGTVSGEYIINSKTDFGCDSIVNLTLTISTSGLFNNVYSEYFNIAPNPVKLGSPTYVNYNFSDSDKDGLYIEVFNSVGTRVYSHRPDTYPINIGEFVGSTGLYVVRIITGTNKVLLGKLIVQ